MTFFDIQSWGTVPYELALRRMRERHELVASGRHASTLIVCNHPPVFTTGRRFDISQALAPFREQGQPQIGGIPLIRTERGGLFTYHDLGQIILYPIMKLTGQPGEFRRLVWTLEEAVILFLAEFGVEAQRRTGQPGVYCSTGKIASLGLAVKRQTTLHGLAVNISTIKSNFAQIAACGVAGQPITNLADFAPVPDPPLDLAPRLIAHLETLMSHPPSSRVPYSPRPA